MFREWLVDRLTNLLFRLCDSANMTAGSPDEQWMNVPQEYVEDYCLIVYKFIMIDKDKRKKLTEWMEEDD